MSTGTLILMAAYYLPHFLAGLMILSLIVVAKHVYQFERHVQDISHVMTSTFGDTATHTSTFGGLNHILHATMVGIFTHARLLEKYNIQVAILACIQIACTYAINNVLILISGMIGLVTAFFVFCFTHKKIAKLKRYERLMQPSATQRDENDH